MDLGVRVDPAEGIATDGYRKISIRSTEAIAVRDERLRDRGHGRVRAVEEPDAPLPGRGVRWGDVLEAFGATLESEGETDLPRFQRVTRSLRRGRKVVTSTDGLVRFTVPFTWGDLELTEESTLGVGDSVSECYLSVESIAKSELGGVTVAELSEITRGAMRNEMGEVRAEWGPKQITFDGRETLQYEIRAVVDGTPIGYLQLVVDGPEHMHLILTWALERGFAANRGSLDSVVRSFDPVE